jgi:ssDNA-binding Zn-finger/Zn-ribbon topoisomerase 1
MIEKLLEFRTQTKRFTIVCPNCDEQMKQLRKTTKSEFYSCFNCYKSWVYEKTVNDAGKIIATYSETDFKDK